MPLRLSTTTRYISLGISASWPGATVVGHLLLMFSASQAMGFPPGERYYGTGEQKQTLENQYLRKAEL